jgi:3',5'-cyclic AMP phosphodiesterase CpdA
LSAPLASANTGGPQPGPGETAIIRLGHISDLHIADKGRYPRHGLTPKDCDKHSTRLLKGLLEALEELRLDHLVVTGDVTLSGEPSEFEKARKLLEPWAEAGKLTVLPGNHDVWSYESAEKFRFLRLVGPDGHGMKSAVQSYPRAVPLGEDAVLVALDSARWGEDPWTTPGKLGTQQLKAARELIRDHARHERAVLLAVHHHLVLPPERVASDAKVSRMPLADADQVVRLVAELPIAAVLHGHRHVAFRVDLPGASGTTPVLCAGSASRVADEPVRRARAFVYEVDRTGIRNVEAFVAGME